MGAARGVEDDDIVAAEPALALGAPGDFDWSLVLLDRQRVDADLLAEHAQLLLGGRTAVVERGHQDLLALPLFQPLGDLARMRGLAGALQAHHQDADRRRGVEIERHGRVAQHLDQFVMDDLDDLLARRHRARDLGADGALAYRVDERLDHFERHVGLEQRAPNLAQRGIDVGGVERAAAREAVEDFAKPVA
jgi:hypothetical protein